MVSLVRAMGGVDGEIAYGKLIANRLLDIGTDCLNFFNREGSVYTDGHFNENLRSCWFYPDFIDRDDSADSHGYLLDTGLQDLQVQHQSEYQWLFFQGGMPPRPQAVRQQYRQ